MLHNLISSPHFLCQARGCFPCCALIQLLPALLVSATPNPHNNELIISVAQLPTKESLIKSFVFIMSTCIPIPGISFISRLQIYFICSLMKSGFQVETVGNSWPKSNFPLDVEILKAMLSLLEMNMERDLRRSWEIWSKLGLNELKGLFQPL